MLVVSFISLGIRTGIIVALSVPLVLAITFVGMMLLGIDFQRISLGALIIALGLLVDDAIIAVEMMMVKLEQGASRLEAATYAYTSTAFPMLTGTLVTAVGFVPVGFARSSAGEYTNSIFWVVGLSLIISWFVAVLFTPWMGYHLLPTPKVAASRPVQRPPLHALPQAGHVVRHLAQDHDRRHGAGLRGLDRGVRPGVEAVLPDRQPARADRRPEAGAGRLVGARPTPR